VAFVVFQQEGEVAFVAGSGVSDVHGAADTEAQA
jgi:hypothetical protein